MTIYRIYTENNNHAGFWVQHRDWNNMCARVQSIGGHESGRLPGHSPLHDDATIVVECFDVRSGRPLAHTHLSKALDDKHFATIAKPAWY